MTDGLGAQRVRRRIALVPQLDTMPRLVAFAGTVPGRLALVAAFGALLAVRGQAGWPLITLVLTLTSLAPSLRRQWLFVAALGWTALAPPVALDFLLELASESGNQRWVEAWPVSVAAVHLLGAGFVWLVRRYPTSVPGRFPLSSLLAVLVGLLAVSRVTGGTSGGVLISAAAMAWGRCLWFFAYAACPTPERDRASFWVRFGVTRPFWGFTNVPFGKGAAYLERVEAKDARELAVTQLKGLKLMLWAVLLMGAWTAVRQLHPLVPTYSAALEALVSGHPPAWGTRWVALIVHFVESMLWLAVLGHTFIATCRMAGFNAFRNTYRPLTSTTIAEFYNRYYFYFKELLVHFFFFPTWFSIFRKHPRLRLFTATFLSAGVGNFLFHYFRDDAPIFRLGFWGALVAYQGYACYALLLALGIGLSQARAVAGKRRVLTGARRVAAIAGVLLFYCLLSVFEGADHTHTVTQYGAYLASLISP